MYPIIRIGSNFTYFGKKFTIHCMYLFFILLLFLLIYFKSQSVLKRKEFQCTCYCRACWIFELFGRLFVKITFEGSVYYSNILWCQSTCPSNGWQIWHPKWQKWFLYVVLCLVVIPLICCICHLLIISKI